MALMNISKGVLQVDSKQPVDVGSTLMQKLKSTSWCLPGTYSSYIST